MLKDASLALPPAAETAEATTQGETWVWEEAVRLHGRMLFRIAYAVLRHREDAEDAVQETLQRAWRYRHRLAVVENPAAWLARIAWRVSRHRRPRPGMVSIDVLTELRELRASGIPADELAARREMQAWMEQLVQKLPASLRRPLLLSTVEELTSPEIAFILGIPESSVRSRCLRARRLLRTKMSRVLEGRLEAKNA